MGSLFLIKKANYVTSAVKSSQFLTDKLEIAFVGRSNVGKSSLINYLVNQKHLAKTSQVAGLTKMVNYFSVNDSLYFVDLPGYGYSRTGKKHQKIWSTLIEDYLKKSKRLKIVFMLVDIRHKPTELDIMMQKFLFYNAIPYRILATKADKIAKTKISIYLNELAKKLQITANNIIPVSVETGLNKDKVLEIIGEINE